MASIVYIDEELPEITIREFYTDGDGDGEGEGEGDGENKIGVNIHSTAELMDQLILLLQKVKDTSSIPIHRKALGMLEIHKELLKIPLSDISLSHIPVVNVIRHNVEDEQDVFHEKYEQASKIDNYYLRREEMRKAFLIFESTNTTEPPQWKVQGEIELESGDRAIIQKEDNIQSKIRSFKMYQGISPFDEQFDKLSLCDKIDSVKVPWKELMITSPNMEDYYEQLAHPELDEFVAKIEDIDSLYGLWKNFIGYGVDLETYDEEEWDVLIKKLQTLQKKDKEVFTFLKPLTFAPQPLKFPEVGGLAFYHIQQGIIQRIIPVLSKLQTNLLELYRVFSEATPINRIDTSNLPKTIYDLAMKIQEQSADFTMVVDLIKTMLLNERLKELDQWMKAVYQWDIEGIEEKVASEVKRYERTETSIYDELHWPLTSLTTELKEIKRGSVIVQQFDENEHRTDDIFEYVPEFTVEDDNPDEILLPVYDDALPIDISALEESQKEVQEIALRMIMELQKATGLPLEIAEIYEQMPILLRLSRFVQLKEALPDVDEGILAAFIRAATSSNQDAVIESLVPSAMYQHAKISMDKVNKLFIEDLFNYYTTFVSLWVCDLQNQVLNRTLKFNIWQGSLNSIHLWSPYGTPMEGIKLKKEGLIHYLMAVIHDLTFTKGTLWDRYALTITKDQMIEKMLALFEVDFQPLVVKLQEQFKTFEKEIVNRGMMERGEAIKKKLVESVEQRNKNRYLTDYMAFLKNLPSVLIQSSIAKKIHLGCCLQALNEKYRSDYDWATIVKEAYKIKKLYATQRFGTDKRPTLKKYEHDLEKVEVPAFNVPYDQVVYEKMEVLKVAEWYDAFKPWMPLNDFTILQSGVRNLVPVIEKYVSIYRFTLRIPAEPFEDAFMNKLNVTDLLQMFRKVVQVQYKRIQGVANDQEFLQKEFAFPEVLTTIQGYFNEVQEQSMKRMLQYFIIRQLCFPARPEYAQANVLVLNNVTVAGDLVKLFTGRVYEDIRAWMDGRLFNTQINFVEYMGKMREQENLSKLNLIDQMTPEERKVYVDNKKLGLTEVNDYLERFREQQEERRGREEIDDPYERDGEDEYYPHKGENDDEVNPDDFGDAEF